MPDRTIVVFGDSTTARRGQVTPYSDLLADALPGDRIVNAGVGGNNTGHALARLEADVLAEDPDVVVIQFGINDASVDLFLTPPATTPRVSLAEYETNLRTLVAAIREGGATPVLMTPNLMRWTLFMRQHYPGAPYDHGDPDGFNVVLRDYSAAMRRLAAELDVTLVDVWAAYEAEATPDRFLLDGVHPNDDGQRLVADLLLPILKECS